MYANLPIGCGLHVSIVGSIDQAVDRAKEKTCDTFQIFTRNPRGWKSKPLGPDEITKFRRKVLQSGISPVFAHMPYLANLSSPKKVVHKKSVRTLTEELDRCGTLGIPYVVTHLGSHLGKGWKVGLKQLIEAINTAFARSQSKAILLLENTAGTTNSMGSSFEEIQEIISHFRRSRVAICFDTCHAFAAGYDLRNTKSVETTINKLEDSIGLDSLALIHANDSKGELASRIDRHEHIGLGYIGAEGFRAFLHADVFRRLPIILETPINILGADIANLKRIRELAT